MNKPVISATLIIYMTMLWGCATIQHLIIAPPDTLTNDRFRSIYSKCLTQIELHSYSEDSNRALWENDIVPKGSLEDIWLGENIYVGITRPNKEWQFRVVATPGKDDLAITVVESIKSCIVTAQPSVLIRVESRISVDLR